MSVGHKVHFYPNKHRINLSACSFSSPACSSCVFSEAMEAAVLELVTEEDSEEERQRKERIPQKKADIARCWSKYCLDLLVFSKEKCLEEMKEDTENGASCQIDGQEGQTESSSGSGETNKQTNKQTIHSLIIG